MKFSLVLFFLLSFQSIQAQKVVVDYLTKYGNIAEDKKDVATIRELTMPDTGYVVGLKEFYANGKLKVIGSVYFNYGRINNHGDFAFFDTNGKKKETVSFIKDVRNQPAYYFYENGAVMKKVDYEYVDRGYAPDFWIAEENKIPNVYFGVKSKLTYYADSLGKVIVKNGDGYVVEKLDYLGEDFIEEGTYALGRKNGVWKGRNVSGTKIFSENYKSGKLISGVMNFEGKKYRYNTLFTRPIFGLGNNHVFQAYLEKIKFQSSFSINQNDVVNVVSGKAIIDETGTVRGFYILDELPIKELKAPLISAIKNMPKWQPAKLRGLNVKAEYTSGVSIFTNEPKTIK